MNILQMLELGKASDLRTVGECAANVQLHAGNIFTYEEAPKEMYDLMHALFMKSVDMGMTMDDLYKLTIEEYEEEAYGKKET